MENNAIAISGMNIPDTFNFKSDTLTALATRIATAGVMVGQTVTAANIEIAKALAEVESSKAYELDGYKSASDFAKQVFNLNPSNASQYIGAAKQFYNRPENADIIAALGAKATPSNLYEFRGCNPDTIRKAIEEGAITSSSTQKDIRAWAEDNCSADSDRRKAVEKKRKAEATPKPVPTLEVFARYGSEVMELTTNETPNEADAVTAEAFRLFHITENLDSPSIVHNLPAVPADGEKVRSIKRAVRVSDEGACVFVQWRVVTEAKKAKKADRPFIPFSRIENMIATMGEEQTRAFLGDDIVESYFSYHESVESLNGDDI